MCPDFISDTLETGEDLAAVIMDTFERDPETLKQLLAIMADPDSPEARKLKEEIRYLASKKSQ